MLLTSGAMSLTLSIGQLLPRSTFGVTGSTMPACFLLVFNFFSLVSAVMKQTPVLSSTRHKKPARKLALSVFPKDTTM